MDEVAKAFHDLVAGLPPESAKIVFGMIVNEAVHYDLGDADIEKHYFESRMSELDDIKRGVMRQFVSKRLVGEDVGSLEALAEAIGKAQSIGFSNDHEKWDPRQHPRDSRGRFGDKPGRAFHDPSGTGRKSTLDTMNYLAGAAERSARYAQSPNIGNETFVPGVTNLRRIGAGANFLNATVGGYMPAPAQLGLHGASFVGRYGAEAQKAFGPAIDQAKYRYKGTERKLDDGLVDAMAKDRKAQRNLITGKVRSTSVRRNDSGGLRSGKTEETSSETMKYFQDLVPSKALSHLQRLSGHQPPSQGIIIDDQGKVAAQMHGSGDDWYLPFDLRNLGNLKGGQYIRTRTEGGLTTEDIYTGLMSGARQMTVVSRNGIYTMTFDPTLRGSRRYSQTARQMTDRYGKLLDAVKNGQATYATVADIDPDRIAELRAESSDNPVVFRQKLAENQELPQPSQELQRQWGTEFLMEHTGSESAQEAHERVINSMVRQRLLADAELVPGVDVGSATNPDTLKAEAEYALEVDPRQGASAMGRSTERAYDRFMDERVQNYRQALAPIELNGPGYDYAMQALKEQFPYFIKSVNYQPNERGGRDHGYVKPRFNRSADVKAGYFDPSINGFGKVPASRTRYQNNKRQQTVETGWRPEGTPAAEVTSSVSGGGSSGGTTPATPAAPGGGGGSTPAPTSPDVNARRAADLAYIKALTTATKVGSNFRDPHFDQTWYTAQRGSDRAAHTGWMAKPEHGYQDFARPMTDFEQMDDEALHRKALEMEAKNRNGFVDVPNDVQAAFNRGGAPAPMRKIEDTDLLDVEPDDNEDWDFGPEFDAGRTQQAYSKTFYDHPAISAARRDGKLGHISDLDFPEKANDYIEAQQADLADAHERGEKGSAQAQRIAGSFMAKQLHRRYHLGLPHHGGGGATPTFVNPNASTGGLPSPSPITGRLVRLENILTPGYDSMN